jgi:Tfp pilus assembly protein PilX
MKSAKNHILVISKLNNKRGSALMLVIMLFLVISVLTVAVLAVAGAEHAQIIAKEKIDQAHYTARAVVQATADWISSNYNDRTSMALVIPNRANLGEANALTVSSTLNGQEYNLKVWRSSSDADVVHLEATAYFQGQHATVNMHLQETVSGYMLFEDAIYSKGPFGKSSGNANMVYGSVATGSDSIPDNLNNDGYGRTTNKYYDFEDILPAADIIFPAKIETATLGHLHNIVYINDEPGGNLNAHYGTLTIRDNVYIKNTDALGNPKDVHILVENLYITKSAVIYPQDYDGGYIYIYVRDYISCDMKFGIGGHNAHPIVFLICSGIGDIDFSGNPVMNAYIYGPDVNVRYGGTTDLNGAVIANVYGWNGNINVYYRKPELEGTPFEALNEQQKKVSIMYQTWYNG